MVRINVEEAVGFAAEQAVTLGFLGAPKVIGVSKNVSVLIDGAGVVARVTDVARSVSLARELAVAEHLRERGAPAIRPAFPHVQHVSEAFAISYWVYEEPIDADFDSDSTMSAVASSLTEVHRALLDFETRLPSYRRQIDNCYKTMMGPGDLCNLTPLERKRLVMAHDYAMDRLSRITTTGIVLHGDAHMGNVCMTASGPKWLDFEDVCVGPREWDIVRFGETRLFEDADPRLLSVLGVLRSICVATWCANQQDKAEDAEYHTGFVLDWLKTHMAN
jgi:Ser/Thr protein kinase RdoA (MazF antagonist)